MKYYNIFFLTYFALLAFNAVVFTGVKVSGIFETPEQKSNLLKRSSTEHPCTRDSDCGSGICKQDGQSTSYYCQCDDGWTDDSDGKICNYQRKSELIAFLVSFFVGGLGVDWFYLARGNAGYIVGGVFKLLTLGCCGIWWTVDWIRILANGFPDGNGYDLWNNM